MVAVLLVVIMIAGILCMVKKWKKNHNLPGVTSTPAYTRMPQ